MGVFWIALLALAVTVLVLAEWPHISKHLPVGEDASRRRRRRKSDLRIVRSEPLDDTEDFAASVQRDLEQLPTIKERDRNR